MKILLIVLCGLILSCGNKGPLYIPQAEEPHTQIAGEK
ncbi:MAG: lipoprotein [Gammaproteobacteria bacterium]|nr:lipoprotein [Gammaproteobacteria bacterium]